LHHEHSTAHAGATTATVNGKGPATIATTEATNAGLRDRRTAATASPTEAPASSNIQK
jgi:hypothetical protein